MAKRILLVDDDKTQLVWMSEALLKKDYEVDVAINGVIALEKVRSNKPDLVITDVVMPEMDGFQLFKEIRKNKETAGILVLVQTGRKMMEDSFAALGVTDFLSKPCQPEALYAKVETILSRIPSSVIPDPLPIAESKAAAVRPTISSKGHVELTPAQKAQLSKNYLKAGVIFGSIIFVISLGVFLRAKVFISANKDHSVAKQLMVEAVDEHQLNGEINEYDEQRHLRATMFYDHGTLKWRKLYDEKGNLTAQETY